VSSNESIPYILVESEPLNTSRLTSYQHRYHSAAALRLMNKYRIGRIDGPWTNFTPPIRGGVFREVTHDVEAGTDSEGDTDTDWSSYPPSVNSSRSSLNLVDEKGGSQLDSVTLKDPEASSSLLRPLDRDVKHRCNIRKVPDHVVGTSEGSTPSSREAYTSSVLQKEIEDNIGSNPSLDEGTQREIAVKYQRLHDRVKDDGFYNCNYVEYGKELTRYTLLFVLFVVCLRAEWYLSSATFLGLFWVNTSSLWYDEPTVLIHL